MKHTIDTNVRILVIGDLMLDHYIYGNCNRISPEAPVQVVEVKNDDYTLGGAGNVLKNLNAFNCHADIISVTGDDENALLVKEHIEAVGANFNGIIKDKNRCTTLKSRVLVANHQLIRLDREITRPIDEQTADGLLIILKQQIAAYQIVLISDYHKGLLSKYFLQEVFNICRAAGVKTLVDPKGDDYSRYKGANLIKPNKKEAIIASGVQITDRRSIHDACIKIKEITACDDVVVTMSEEGMAMYTGEQLDVIPTKALGVIDVTGAGDTVLAALGFALASGNSLHNACDFANHAAAVVVSKVGSAVASLEEIKQKYSA